ncbi:pathogenesis-related protein PR-1-like [Typha angustifolia]|uniref:pathogenesis-related protein PR-1-like n=1 Tax=Typha angustifolia TaxID=59011 RepID=UPI003C2C6EEE
MASPSQYLSSPINVFIPLLFLYSSIPFSSQTLLPPIPSQKPRVDVGVSAAINVAVRGSPLQATLTPYQHIHTEFLSSHNQIRAAYGERPYRWDSRLTHYARRWSSHLRDSGCTIFHSNGPYGENLFWGSGFDWRPSDAISSWASEKEFYNPDANSCAAGKQCGHFTQLVWNGTTHVGCARVECSGDGVIMACSYYPPGNWVGERPYKYAT